MRRELRQARAFLEDSLILSCSSIPVSTDSLGSHVDARCSAVACRRFFPVVPCPWFGRCSRENLASETKLEGGEGLPTLAASRWDPLGFWSGSSGHSTKTDRNIEDYRMDYRFVELRCGDLQALGALEERAGRFSGNCLGVWGKEVGDPLEATVPVPRHGPTQGLWMDFNAHSWFIGSSLVPESQGYLTPGESISS